MNKFIFPLLILSFAAFTTKAQQSFDFKKMQARYEKRQPMLDTMAAYPSREYIDVSAKTRDGIEIAGWFIPGKKKKGTVLMVHGFMMNKSHMLARAETFSKAGMSVLLIDLRARGNSGGDKTSTGKDSALDIEAMRTHYYDNYDKFGPLALYGFSHGGRAVIYAAAELDTKEPVILESPPYSLTNSFKRTYKVPSIPDIDGEGLDPFLQKAADTPLLLMIGDKDTAINQEEAQMLIAHSKSQLTQLVQFTNTAHDVHKEENLKKYEKTVFDFLKKAF